MKDNICFHCKYNLICGVSSMFSLLNLFIMTIIMFYAIFVYNDNYSTFVFIVVMYAGCVISIPILYTMIYFKSDICKSMNKKDGVV